MPRIPTRFLRTVATTRGPAYALRQTRRVPPGMNMVAITGYFTTTCHACHTHCIHIHPSAPCLSLPAMALPSPASLPPLDLPPPACHHHHHTCSTHFTLHLTAHTFLPFPALYPASPASTHCTLPHTSTHTMPACLAFPLPFCYLLPAFLLLLPLHCTLD